MLRPMVAETICATCGKVAARVEVVPPWSLPTPWETWDESTREGYLRYRDPTKWYMRYTGIGAGNGSIGDALSVARVERLFGAFIPPYTWAAVRTAGLSDDAGWCKHCDGAYCYQHWHVDDSGRGTCAAGHARSIDPWEGLS